MEGLRAALHYVDCAGLLRGKQDYEGGVCVNFPGKCITVHTTNANDLSQIRAAYLLLKKIGDQLDVDCSQNAFNRCHIPPPSRLEYIGMMWSFVTNYRKLRYTDYFNKLSRKNMIEHWTVNESSELHFVSPEIIRDWMVVCATRELSHISKFQDNGRHVTTIAAYTEYFPIIFDIIKGLKGTFRVILTDEEIHFFHTVSKKLYCY